MHEGAGKLNQAFVEGISRLPTFPQPKLLENFGGFEVELLGEVFKESQVMRVQILLEKRLYYCGDFRALSAHAAFHTPRFGAIRQSQPSGPPSAFAKPPPLRPGERGPLMEVGLSCIWSDLPCSPKMTLSEIVGLVCAAAAGGAINAVAGGGTLVTFPTLLLFNTPPVVANATSTLALVVGTSGGIYGYG